MKSEAPREYWDFLMPEFEVGAKVSSLLALPTSLSLADRLFRQRRVIDRVGYFKSLKDSKVKLIAEQSLVSTHGDTVTTNKGVEIKTDVVILCTVSLLVRFRGASMLTWSSDCRATRFRIVSSSSAYRLMIISSYAISCSPLPPQDCQRRRRGRSRALRHRQEGFHGQVSPCR